MFLRFFSALLASVIAFSCLFPSVAMAADTNWVLIGNFYGNDLVAEALNQAKVGVGASVGLNIEGTQFTVLGDNKSVVFPGYKWKSIGTGDTSESDLANVANDAGAVSTAETVNANGDWVIWGYVPD
ncbi:hypothetical protein [Okeania sp. KiyG1]|uniref:hypothetical protein n=1 Tax=Okeania sp. KiyG1 TaxID=2720165 RepID=UPI001924AC7F|nr:hypothetical protein [Okeania sp. KiyG1]GGA24115.1 hypothetical protein CYANOKiyG1_39610 [Okeania sp. KiyG1]